MPAEIQAANEHKPLDADGRPLCWGWMTHHGCPKTEAECGRSHKPMRGKLVDLHWTVQAQILRRGGLKSGAAVPVDDVDGRISVLRAAAKASDAAARADGAKTAADRRGGSLWSPPAEFGDLDYTAAEHDLAELVKGPDRQWGAKLTRVASHPPRPSASRKSTTSMPPDWTSGAPTKPWKELAAP